VKIPILELKNILLTSIQVDLSDKEAVEFQGDVLQKAQETEAAGIVIDITALDVVDSYMARVLNDTAQMLKLLGVETVICGMRPEVAITLVEMGRELIGVQTALNLDQGVDRLEALLEDGEGSDG